MDREDTEWALAAELSLGGHRHHLILLTAPMAEKEAGMRQCCCDPVPRTDVSQPSAGTPELTERFCPLQRPSETRIWIPDVWDFCDT